MNKFDTARYNSPSGREDPEPYSKKLGARKVAQVMADNERTQSGFRFGENKAKRINHNAPPK